MMLFEVFPSPGVHPALLVQSFWIELHCCKIWSYAYLDLIEWIWCRSQ